MAANIVQGYEDGGVYAEAVVQEGPCDRLESLLFIRWEKWGGRFFGGPLLCSLAVNGSCLVVRGVLWAFWGFVVEPLEGLFHISWNGDIDIYFRIVTGEGEATVLCPFPID